MNKTTNIITESFTNYAGAVAQSRALVDVRDCIKPSARLLTYIQNDKGYTHPKSFVSSGTVVGAGLESYIHGDSSLYATLARLAKPFAMRYPIEEMKGGYGSLAKSQNESHYRYCITGDTLINTDKGMEYIGEILETEPNSDNKVSFKIKSLEGHSSVEEFYNSGEQDVWDIILRNGMSIRGTENHPLLTLDSDFNFKWKTISELSVGDKLLVDLKGQDTLFGEYENILEARAFGSLVSEGSIGKKLINIINQDIDMVQPVLDYFLTFNRSSHQKPKISFREDCSCYFSNSGAKEVLKRVHEELGILKSDSKKIPKSVFSSTEKHQIEFLKYLFEGDGSCISDTKNNFIVYSSISATLIKEIQILLTNFGIFSYIVPTKGRKELKLYITGENLIKFQKIGFVSDRKNNKLKEAIENFNNSLLRKGRSSQGYSSFPELLPFIKTYYKGKISTSNGKGWTLDKYGFEKIKEHLNLEDKVRLENIFNNYYFVPIANKEYKGKEIVYSPNVSSKSCSFSGNGFINHNTKMRISEFGTLLFQGLKENAILEDEWRENYTQTDIHPMVLPSLGYYNICNGSSGISVGLASSIPQFNLKEMNEALIHMLWGRSYSLPMPDFATGGTIINLKDVKESLQKGQGSSIQIRATIEYEPNDHVLYVKEMPYSVYTETVAKELENIINENENCGIEKFLEITDRAIMEIYLSPRAQASQVINLLYKETSLKSHYGINLTMLKRGKYPQVFTLPEAMQEHLKHEFRCYTNIYKHRLDVAQKRLHILEGYLIVIANIEEVVKTIKSCASAAIAKTELTEKFKLSLVQAEAVLKLTLSRVAALEVQKIVKEKAEVEEKIKEYQRVLNDENELKKIIEKGLRDVMNKYGDARRTKLIDLTDEENIRLLYFTSSGRVFLTKPKTENVINTLIAGTPYMAITQKGFVYKNNEVPARAKKVFPLDKGDTILTVQPAHEDDYLIVYSRDKSFRCLKISAMNKTKTELSIKNIVDAFTTSEKITKSEYLKSK